jgi:hypothetical protein
MKLANHTEHIRQLIDKAFRNRLGRMGITDKQLTNTENIPTEYIGERQRLEGLYTVFLEEMKTPKSAFEKLVEELTFTLFNRLAALKVMEAHTLHPDIVTQRTEYGDRSFAHYAWIEENPEARNQEAEDLLPFFEAELTKLSNDIPLLSVKHPYHLLPTAIELKRIMEAFNAVEKDAQVETDIWKSDDVLGWLYESYNNHKKDAHKASKAKTEYNKVSIQSQVYTPRWVVKFLVDNSLGKLYLEMFPDSEIKGKYKIANAPTVQCRTPKPLHEVKLIDPATGSGNFLLYSFDLFYDLYQDQIEEYDADYNERDIPKLIIENNLHGVDLDDRAIQLAQLGLYIKAKRRNRGIKINHFNIVSSDFFLPAYDAVKDIFEKYDGVGDRERKIIEELWDDLQNAHKFGSLVRLEEKMSLRWFGTKETVADNVVTLFDNENVEDYQTFKNNFFTNLQQAISEHTTNQGLTFLNTKTKDAITFLQLLTQKYEVATANPPYTNSADFGKDLKKFIDTNYKKPHGFHTNLYATFIKRCYELLENKGKMALVHPPTFMYIKTFADVRKFMVSKLHISLFVEWGYLGMFNPTARVDAAMYVLEKEQKEIPTQFIKLNDIYEGRRYEVFVQAYSDLLANQPNKHNIKLPQEKLKIIDGMPFIYWISDGFREKFEGKITDDVSDIKVGINSGNNEQFVRFWWEVNLLDLSSDFEVDRKKWVGYAKGGSYKKWYGNLWLKLNWLDNGNELRNCKKAILRNEGFYFKEGITYSASGSKGVSFRFLPTNFIFDVGGSCVFPKENINNYTLISLLNSKLSFYIVDCLNPTVNTQVGDLKRIPFVQPRKAIETKITKLAQRNIDIKKHRCTYSLIETNYEKSPLLTFSENTLSERVKAYLDNENAALTEVLLNEAIINELVFEVYELSPEDRAQVETKMGKSIGELGISQELGIKAAYLAAANIENEVVLQHIEELPLIAITAAKKQEIIAGFATLYQSNKDLEEFCITHQVNPINVWYWFKESRTLPKARMADIALEFLADAIRTLLTIDEDGIIPLVSLPGEPDLSQRLEAYCLNDLGFSSAQYLQLETLLGRPLNDYLEQHFFKNLSDHLNLFMYLPKTPFIWHLSSGEHQGFEAYILIYKWNRDSLYKLKSDYLDKRKENLEYRLITLQDTNTAQAQTEKEVINLQLDEISRFTEKINVLIAENYNPILDDGVGKNIAPLQKKGLLKAEVLKDKQLEKYLNADW